MATSTEKAYFVPREIAELTGVKLDNVFAWIHSGELRAVNMAAAGNGDRPRWRISHEELERFFAARSNKPAAAPIVPTERRRRKSKPTRQWV